MARYVIAVGGTGQHIALALTRLVRARALGNDIRLIALDADVDTPLPQLLRAPTPSLAGGRHPLGDGVVKPPFDLVRVGKQSFSHLFVDPDHEKERELFECMFDAEEGDIPIYKGLFGTPCVGATVFGEGAESSGVQSLFRPLSSATQVFICGSVVGGTGAGLIHKLIGEVRKHYHGEMYGVFMLPWFEAPAGGAKGAITPALITRNAIHGRKYFYEHTIPLLTTSLLVGFPGTTQTDVVQRIQVREGEMVENASYLHLVAARALIDLPTAATAQKDVKAYAMAHDLAHEGWLLDKTWDAAGNESLGQPLRLLLRALRIQADFLRFLTHEKTKASLTDYYKGGLLNMSSRDAWGDLHESIKDNAPDKQQQLVFVQNVIARFDQLRAEADFVNEWAQRLYPNQLLDLPDGDPLMDELAAALKKGGESDVHWPKLRGWWATQSLRPTQGPRSAEEVANHHAELIFQAAMR